MIYLLSFIIVIGLPVFLHELGHFLAARSVGIKVEKFYIGFNLFGLVINKKILVRSLYFQLKLIV